MDITNTTMNKLPLAALVALSFVVVAWKISPTSAQIGDGFLANAKNFISQANMAAADQNKLADCVTPTGSDAK